VGNISAIGRVGDAGWSPSVSVHVVFTNSPSVKASDWYVPLMARARPPTKRGAWWPTRKRNRSRSRYVGMTPGRVVRQRANYVREGSSGNQVSLVVRPARIHPVKRAVAASYAVDAPPPSRSSYQTAKRVPTRADRKTWHPLRLAGRCSVQWMAH